MKGIILAGGSGTRLAPLTLPTSKQLLPVYDKPMIYYPLSTLMLAGIREVLVITTPHEQAQFRRLLEDGYQWGISISYAIQEKPGGLAQALLIGENFIDSDSIALILGDNIFYGTGMGTALKSMSGRQGATVFAYEVTNPQEYGVIEFDAAGKAISIQEKPKAPRSNFVIPGLYFYDNQVVELAKSLKPSSRGELEISDLHNLYLSNNQLNVEVLDSTITWLDTGTIESLHLAAEGVRKIEKDIGRKINVPEEVSWRLGLISNDQLLKEADKYGKSGYGDYLRALVS
ncbi:glucose-1-phosphate thymidylyltransferase RfbA [Rhodoluna lacicola]|uniref:glucose-1-phosphate thymidylyltransferase RfbA n=1 Tax=Rhodoluna lacicola TaxID=529884 RepID=UPI0022306AB0|nr:glucose-1-phosphate thymidylyltransferase RfbA [Rhodoluna lacicola]BDS49764.1 glucose-1-phosphate thymidylyltransferase [Rhodoluna lacicola]